MKGRSPGGKLQDMTCPAPVHQRSKIIAAHGGGGRLTRQLIERIFQPAFDNPGLDTGHDGAVVDAGPERLVMTTDSYVVQPLFFPGGDIGSLAVNGTVNDLSMCGARPLYLSAAFILEEGLSLEALEKIAASMRRAADEAGVRIVTGDTKVVETGNGDGMFITTTGVGRVETALCIHPSSIRPGDRIVLSGDLARHGIAVLDARNRLGLDCGIESDCAPLNRPVQQLLDAGVAIHCMRDLTRGGMATALVELAQSCSLDFRIQEQRLLIDEKVRGACEILGFDPLYVANEGRFVCFVTENDAERTLEILHKNPVAQQARIVGQVEGSGTGTVVLETGLGTGRRLDLLSGEQLPRIC